MNNYESVYKNTGTTPRTMGEAYKNADYATPIYRMRNEWDDAKDFFVGAFLVLTVFALGVSIALGVLSWLGIAIFQ